ncbi:hypothetical protein CROQUDRAFT_102522 [Cronartium quercuum f. sp. fusiforme G11]|uniref:Uncharacterized protein n=1 Tax=Cronartium quercuum f. sp. fusiforme G11 TaxID=708437 RepID=A0A9P6N4Q3_9BASI|nr:hypothetical protein CROQUDRAFT_102522 [Cronartium quercuum f. sp. fusiforme G11]
MVDPPSVGAVLWLPELNQVFGRLETRWPQGLLELLLTWYETRHDLPGLTGFFTARVHPVLVQGKDQGGPGENLAETEQVKGRLD